MIDIPPHDDFAPEARVARFEKVLRKWLQYNWAPTNNSYPLPYWGSNERFGILLGKVLLDLEEELGFRGELSSEQSPGNRIRFERVR